MKVTFKMSIEIDDKDVANATDEDIIEWLLFEMGKKKERRRLPNPLDQMDIDFTHKPKFMSIVSIERKKTKK